MKTILILTLWISITGVLRADETNDYRVVDGKVYNLKLLKEWEKTYESVRTARKPLEGWERVGGVLIATNSEGPIVMDLRRGDWNHHPNVLIKNLFKPSFIPARKNGIGSSTTIEQVLAFNKRSKKTIQINGNSIEVEIWDYGTVPAIIKKE